MCICVCFVSRSKLEEAARTFRQWPDSTASTAIAAYHTHVQSHQEGSETLNFIIAAILTYDSTHDLGVLCMSSFVKDELYTRS